MLVAGISLVRWPHKYQEIAQRYSRDMRWVPYVGLYINSNLYVVVCRTIGWLTIAAAGVVLLALMSRILGVAPTVGELGGLLPYAFIVVWIRPGPVPRARPLLMFAIRGSWFAVPVEPGGGLFRSL
jgi:hypothetical protein